MSVIRIVWNPGRRVLKLFGFVWLGFFGLFALLSWFKWGSWRVSLWLIVAALVVPAIGWCVPAFMRFVYVGLSLITLPIGWTISHLALAMVFFLVIMPTGLIMRILGRDPMDRRFDSFAASYWKRRPSGAGANPRRYFRQF